MLALGGDFGYKEDRELKALRLVSAMQLTYGIAPLRRRSLREQNESADQYVHELCILQTVNQLTENFPFESELRACAFFGYVCTCLLVQRVMNQHHRINARHACAYSAIKILGTFVQVASVVPCQILGTIGLHQPSPPFSQNWFS